MVSFKQQQTSIDYINAKKKMKRCSLLFMMFRIVIGIECDDVRWTFIKYFIIDMFLMQSVVLLGATLMTSVCVTIEHLLSSKITHF